MKTVAMCLIMVLCSGIGIYKTLKLIKRKQTTYLLLKSFSDLSLLIRVSKCSCTEGLMRLKGRCDLFDNMIASKENDPILSFDKVKNDYMTSHCLLRDDVDVIRRFFESIGKTDSEGEEKVTYLVQTELDKIRRDAEERYNKYAKLYTVFGLAAGVFVVILLM